jgi:stage V sporulation protein D (sporulation-specific penicillin-binding protein)
LAGASSHVVIRKRVALLFLIVAVVMCGLVGRLVHVQFFRSGWLLESAIDQRVRDIPVEAKRGTIYDRSGKEMAVSINTESVYAIPAEISNKEQAASQLASILNLEYEKVLKKVKQRSAFVWLERKIDSEKAQQIKAMNIPGVGLTQESKRYYPHNVLAAHVLGFSGIDSQGLDGVESTFDTYLKGKKGQIVIEYDASGREIPNATHKFNPPQDGDNVYLTIDQVVQFIIERELDRVMQETQAKAATIVAMNPKTGEILGLANRPTYDPNHYGDFSPNLWRNIALSNSYEPGSTFKIVTAAAGLQEKAVRQTDSFYDPGYAEVQGRHIRCWKAGGHGSQTFLEVVKNSCNPGFIAVGLRLGKDVFYNYLEAFGFGKHTDIELPGEAKGILIAREQAKPINIATMSMGQSVAVTPIQLLSALSAVANDGVLVKPQIVREIRSKDGNLVKTSQPEVVRQVVSQETAQELKGILEQVVADGSGRNAYISGYRIAGKTGTAQKVGAGGYEQGRYIASFGGFAPANDPSIALLVIIDEPQGLYYGGQIAAPVFGQVMKDVLQYLKIPMQVEGSAALKNKNAVTTPNIDIKVELIVPSVVNLVVADADKLAKDAGLGIIVEGQGLRIVDQIPKAGSKVPGGTQILAYSEPRFVEMHSFVTVPDVKGKSLRDVGELLGDMGLILEAAGIGNAIQQDPAPGMKVGPGSTVRVQFELPPTQSNR